jgi:preprotein translocase subunit YajC
MYLKDEIADGILLAPLLSPSLFFYFFILRKKQNKNKIILLLDEKPKRDRGG